MAGTDFVEVQLSAAGVKMAGASGTVGVHNGRRDFVFKAGVPQKVLAAYEWSHVLAPTLYQGQPVFELAPAAGSAAIPNAPAPAGGNVISQHTIGGQPLVEKSAPTAHEG